jgi:hypothetical protein
MVLARSPLIVMEPFVPPHVVGLVEDVPAITGREVTVTFVVAAGEVQLFTVAVTL